MVDWTQVGEYDLLWLQIPCRGRSLPLVGFVVSGRGDLDEEAWKTLSEKEVLTRLRNCWPAEFPPPLLLMDRGFDKGPLLSWLNRSPIEDIAIGTDDLRSLYEQYHRPKPAGPEDAVP